MSKLSIYCEKCGARSIYAAEKPNFCNKCGHSFNGSSVASSSSDSLPEDNGDVESIPSISRLEVETELYAHRPIRMEDVIESQRLAPGAPQGGGSEEAAQYRQPSDMSHEQIMEDFKREAGTRGKGD